MVRELVEVFLIIGRSFCIVLEGILYLLDVLSMKSIGLKVFKKDDIYVVYKIKCICYEEMIGYLFIICMCLIVKGNEKYVLFRV